MDFKDLPPEKIKLILKLIKLIKEKKINPSIFEKEMAKIGVRSLSELKSQIMQLDDKFISNLITKSDYKIEDNSNTRLTSDWINNLNPEDLKLSPQNFPPNPN